MDWLAVGTFVAGLIGGYTIKIAVDIKTNNSGGRAEANATGSSVAQSGNVAGGHIAGGNITTEK
jgi:hypothetical protein